LAAGDEVERTEVKPAASVSALIEDLAGQLPDWESEGEI
jgi:hypothetical protein